MFKMPPSEFCLKSPYYVFTSPFFAAKNPHFDLVKSPDFCCLNYHVCSIDNSCGVLPKSIYPPKKCCLLSILIFRYKPTESNNPPFAEHSICGEMPQFLLLAVNRRNSKFCWSMFWLANMSSSPAWNLAKIRVMFAGLSLRSSQPRSLGMFFHWGSSPKQWLPNPAMWGPLDS